MQRKWLRYNYIGNLPRSDNLNEKAQEVSTALHELCASENLWIIKYQNVRNLDIT